MVPFSLICSLDSDFQKWIDSTLPLSCKHFGLNGTKAVSCEPQFKVIFLENAPEKLFDSLYPEFTPNFSHVYDLKFPFRCDTVSFKRLVESDREYFEAELAFLDKEVRYFTGDHIAILPQNCKEEVDKLASALKLDLNTIFELKTFQESQRQLFPSPCTFQAAFGNFLEICQPPKPHIIRLLAEHAKNDKEKYEILELIHVGADKSERSKVLLVADILIKYKSIEIPIERVFELFNAMKFRYYSISSTSINDEPKCTITAVKVQYDTPTGTRKGVATHYLQNAKNMPCFIRETSFKLPRFNKRPIIMICGGTGIAPFMGFLRTRKRLIEQGTEFGESILYFGCRTSRDFIYENEINEFLQCSALTELHCAFSRENGKLYVQDIMKKHKDKLVHLIENEGHVYVCGDAQKLGKSVKSALYSILDVETNSTLWDRMLSASRYKEDIW